MADNSDSDSDCWYNQDEEEIVKSVKDKTHSIDKNVEFIEGPDVSATTENYIKDHNLAAAQNASAKTNWRKSKATIAELKKIVNLAPLDIFLYTFTHEPGFFASQLAANDTQNRVLLYLRIYQSICSLQLPGFHKELLTHFVNDNVLLEHLQLIATKLFSQRYKNAWSSNGPQVEEILADMQMLFTRSHQLHILTTRAVDAIRYISNVITKSDYPAIAERADSIELSHQLGRILDEFNTRQNHKEKGIHSFASDEIFPTLQELLATSAVDVGSSDTLTTPANCPQLNEYIVRQKELLREDFMILLRDIVTTLRKDKTFDTLHDGQHSDDVHIVLNEQFLDAHRHEMLFVDFMGSQRDTLDTNNKWDGKKQMDSLLKNVKTGALLCLTTSFDFEDLILATVTFTAPNVRKYGYIGIQVARQYNIGNIYNRRFICFETPAFFEPYSKVYSYLNVCNINQFPMEDFIVFGKKDVKAPAYLETNTVYKYINQSFKPLSEDPLPKKLPLNLSQLEAYRGALTHELYLIQGPPGTGKTHLSIELVKTLMKNVESLPIVIVTFTNESLDKFLVKLSSYTDDIIRFGSQGRQREIDKFNVQTVAHNSIVNPDLKRLYYTVNLEFNEKFEHLQQLHREFDGTDEGYHLILDAQRSVDAVTEKLNSIRIMFQYYAARGKAIIAMTTTCAAKINFLFHLLKSSIIIFEEAAEILESHALACLTPYTQHVVMIGDHMQLQPYTSFQHGCASKLNVSLFERLFKGHIPHAVLNTQYRMRPAICELVCNTIYENLHNDDSVEKYPLVRNMSKNLYFLTHNEPESKTERNSSVYNDYEVAKVLELVNHLVNVAKYKASDLVILSPYAKQIELIQTKLSGIENAKHNVNAATVDSYQGLEAKIVLLSLVRSNAQKKIGFLNEPKRVCVALSRAQQGLYMIGNMALLAKCSATWRSINSKLESQDAIGNNEFPYDFSN